MNIGKLVKRGGIVSSLSTGLDITDPEISLVTKDVMKDKNIKISPLSQETDKRVQKLKKELEKLSIKKPKQRYITFHL